jgi:hypothetical protein
MPDTPSTSAARFQESFSHLTRFLGNWADKIDQQAHQDRQREACYYIWARWTLLIRTIHHTCGPAYIPDIYLLTRSCIECDASFKAIQAEPKLADEYLDFPDKAKAYYAWLCQELGDADGLAALEPELKACFGNDWEKHKAMQWLPKTGPMKTSTSELVETYCGPDARLIYAHSSHFVHGSAVVAQYMRNTMPTGSDLDKAIGLVYSGYLLSTRDLLKIVWGPVLQKDSELCQKEFSDVAGHWIKPA